MNPIGLNLIGNDIVDLKTPEAMGKAADSRFVRRVLNADEQQAVFGSAQPDSLLWGLWAAKEAAFKAISKSDPTVSSAPGRYPVILDLMYPNPENTRRSVTGRVMTPNGCVPVTIDFHEEHVHCIGVFGPPDILASIVYGMDEITPGTKQAETGSVSEKESAAVRRLAKKHIAAFLQTSEQDIRIIRHQTHHRIHPPKVYARGRSNPMEISLSHDGRFAAYAFLADSSQLKGK